MTSWPSPGVTIRLVLTLSCGPLWLWLAALAGLNLIQASFAGFRPRRDGLQAVRRETRNRLSLILRGRNKRRPTRGLETPSKAVYMGAGRPRNARAALAAFAQFAAAETAA